MQPIKPIRLWAAQPRQSPLLAISQNDATVNNKDTSFELS